MSEHRGVVAAGHPLTADAGASVLRAGGNAVDAAVAAVLTSFVTESPLTGIGAGGFMLVHTPEGDDHLLDFFVSAPAAVAPAADQVAIEVDFEGARQVFNCGAASCGVYGTLAGVWEAARRFGTMPVADLAETAINLAKFGVATTPMHEFLYRVLAPILTEWPECRSIYAPDGALPREGDVLEFPELSTALERFAAEGPEPFYRGDIADRVCSWVQDRGGTISQEDLANYQVIDRVPGRVAYRDREVVTNPPPSSGGVLIALSLQALARLDTVSPVELVAALAAANAARNDNFARGLMEPDFFDRFLRTQHVATGLFDGSNDSDAVGSTTHLSVLDAEGMAVSCTCSNGSGSGVAIPGTGIVLNNMLGETDLHPLGIGAAIGGERVTSMMAPTVMLRDGRPTLVLGSAGSNRIRSTILQTISNIVDQGMSIAEAIDAPRLHFEDGVVQAEPGVDEAALKRLEGAGVPVVRWAHENLFFGGCQAVGIDPDTGVLAGAGDPRRGGAVEFG